MEKLKLLPGALLPWYEQNKRDLPWRRDREPYHIWLSEIMLQQTRVEAVKGYYARFLEKLPTIEALASCDEEILLKLWEGLGYYSRVRNLKKAAREIMSTHGGQFPNDYPSIRKLPGIGDYTAGAICSIAFDLPTPAVDGNVLRVLSRLRSDGASVDEPKHKKRIQEELAKVYPPQAAAFTQALMELGATVCLPNGEPKCEICPCRDFCDQNWRSYPVRKPKAPKRKQQRTVFVLRCGEKYALTKRPDEGLLAGLWQFPDTPGHMTAEQAVTHMETLGLRPTGIEKILDKKHIFTHIQWDMKGIYLTVAEPAGGFTWMDASSIQSSAALPTAYRQFWEDDRHV